MEHNWQVVITFVYPHEAYLAKAYLESEGLETEIRDELTAQVNYFYSTAIGGVKLLVRDEDINRGIELLKKGGYLVEPDEQKPKIEIVPVKKGFKHKNCPFCKSKNTSINKIPGFWWYFFCLF